MADEYEQHGNHRYCEDCDYAWYGPQQCEMCGAQGCNGPIVRLVAALSFKSGTTAAKWVADLNDPVVASPARSSEPGHAQ